MTCLLILEPHRVRINFRCVSADLMLANIVVAELELDV